MKKLAFFSFLVLVVSSYAQIKVACVGNSITYGSGIKERETYAYPFQMQKMLGEEWEVGNFGNSGSTLLKNGDKPYWKQKQYKDAIAMKPDVVVIKLGTNDSKPQNWKYREEYINDYKSLIKEFKKNGNNPVIYVCLPVPAYGIRWGINDSIIIHDVIPQVRVVAEETDAEVIDLFAPLSGKEEMFPDKIHPNKDGAKVMAEVITSRLLTRKQYIINRKQ